MMDAYSLTNARGETVQLNNFDSGVLAYGPTGLGVNFTNTYSQYQTHFKLTKSMVSQGQYAATIVFGQVESLTYSTFNQFASFLAYQPLTLAYSTDAGTWKRDARLLSLGKSEKGGGVVASDRINESFTLEFINPWYNNKIADYKSYNADPNLGTYGKIYRYAYQPYYVYQESNRPSTEKAMSLNNRSQYFGIQKGSPSLITITGPTGVNPFWTVIQNGNVVGTDGFALTLTDNQKLVVSSYPEDQYARVYNPDGSYVDVSQLQDYTKTNFVQIPEGESTAIFYLDITSQVDITFKEERLLV